MSTRDEARSAVYKALSEHEFGVDGDPFDEAKTAAHALLMLAQEDRSNREAERANHYGRP